MRISSDEFRNVAIECNFDPYAMSTKLRALYPDMELKPNKLLARLERYRKKGLLPLDSGNSVSVGEVLKGSSTLYDEQGNVKLQWIKTDVPKQQFLDAFNEAIQSIAENINALPTIQPPTVLVNEDLATLYISNDIHYGAYNWGEETESDWNLDLASTTVRSAYDHLFMHSPNSKVGIIADLGDLLEVDNDKNMTPKSGNVLDVDTRYPKILRAAYEGLIYAVNCALKKHELVYFYNITGNHDINAGVAVREVIRMAFLNNPRVIVDDSPRNIKYHLHGTSLLQFAHGDNMKMHTAGEVMAHDCCDIFSSTKNRYAHFGHTHKDAVVDTRLCRAESHRNVASLNAWAFNHGYRRSPGTMKSITYHTKYGETTRQIYNINS